MMAATFSRVLLLSPVIFVCHFLEESPTFVTWFNSHVDKDITSELFWSVNISAFLITTIVAGLEWSSRSALSLAIAIMWLSFLMLANAMFHLVGSAVDRGYVPGVITAAFLYLPYFAWTLITALRSNRVGSGMLSIALLVGALPMSIHGYLILFRGSRLF